MPLTCLLGALAYSLPTRPVGIAPPAFSAPQPPPLLERAPSSPRMVASTTPASTAVAPVKVMIAGGGIGGLCTALVLRKLGFDVAVYEKASEYKPFGGPIQIASNALESLRRIDADVYADILAKSTIIGDRINGLKDGVSNEWFATFDLASPATKRGQEASVVIDRPVLQDILLERVGDALTLNAEVVSYDTSAGQGVTGVLADGTRVDADLLVGSDGIWSKVRTQLDPSEAPQLPVWSGYTCFAAIANCVPDDIADVGYKVFLGPRKYFVSVDVGEGRIQWYAFLNIPAGESPKMEGAETLEWLKTTQFDGWSPEVHQLIDSTPVDAIEQRDLYDRPPQFKWTSGNVCLLGDAVHPMMPNLGQGGGMAIEDALVLGQEMEKAGTRDALPLALRRYASNRLVRSASVQGMSRLSSAILFQYNHPTKISAAGVENTGVKSMITKSMQGFLQNVAFPLQFEYLFSFPGSLDPNVFAEEGGLPEDGRLPAAREQGEVAEPGTAEKRLLNGEMGLGEWLSSYW